MRRYSLNHCYEAVPNTKEDVATCLMNLADCDCDFNGENGDDYLWDEAEGFESNAEYCLSEAKEESTPSAMVAKFLDMWMGRDSYYWDYDLGTVVEGDTLFISLAYIIEA